MTWGPPPEGAWSPDDARPPSAPYGAVAWQPGGPPIGVPAPPPGSLPPPPPGPPSSDRRRGALVAGVVALVVVALGTTVGVVLGTRGDDSPPPAADPASRTTTSASTAAPTTPSTPASTADAPTTSAAPTPTVAPSQAYTAPGGLSVLGPVGWTADGSANNGNIRDFDAPGSPARLAGATFRIGIGNATPSGSFQDEVTAAANFQVTDKDATIISTTYSSFLGTTAGDIEYSYFNATYGVQRKGVERIWRSGGVTLIIQSSDVETHWVSAAAVFHQLIASARVG